MITKSTHRSIDGCLHINYAKEYLYIRISLATRSAVNDHLLQVVLIKQINMNQHIGMDVSNSLIPTTDDFRMDITASQDWWSDLLRTSECGSWSSSTTSSDSLPVEYASTYSSFDSPISCAGYLESPMSYANQTHSSPVSYGYNLIAPQQSQCGSSDYSPNPTTMVKVEVSFSESTRHEC